MKLLMITVNGVEESEALYTRDVLIRGGIEVDMMNIDEEAYVISSHQLKIETIPYFNDYSSYDGLVLPGGKRGVNNIDNSSKIDEILKYFFLNKKLVSAICAAPSLLGKRGYLKNKPFTCYPGWEIGIDGNYQNNEVTVYENIITGRSVDYSSLFALKIIGYLKGEEEMKRIEKQIKGII